MKELIEILLDKQFSISERDDAAMDLDEFDSDLALDALISIAKSSDENPTVLNSCGESIASIWLRRNIFDKKCFESLAKEAQDGVYYVLKHDKPDCLRNE